jgi:hypothetical protein
MECAEPPAGVEPATYALRVGRWCHQAHPPARMPRPSPLNALRDLADRRGSCHASCHGGCRSVITHSHHELLGRGGISCLWDLISASSCCRRRMMEWIAGCSPRPSRRVLGTPRLSSSLIRRALGRGGHRPVPGLPQALPTRRSAPLMWSSPWAAGMPVRSIRASATRTDSSRTRPASPSRWCAASRRDQRPRPAAPRRTRPSTRLVQDIAALTLACDL